MTKGGVHPIMTRIVLGARPWSEETPVNQFTEKHRAMIVGQMSGWDRLVFRGTRRFLCAVAGMMGYLYHSSVKLTEFGQFSQALTRRLMEASLAAAERAGRPVKYLESSQEDKEKVALQMLREHPIASGLVGVIKCVETCMSFEVHRNRAEKTLELRRKLRKGLHLYHYFLDPVFGWMGARIQTWLPFRVQVWVNGREWLARRMDAAGSKYERADNGFPWIEDPAAAQSLMDELTHFSWGEFLDGIAARLKPAAGEMFAEFPVPYYWSAFQTEWATDVMFRSGRDLAGLYPALTWGAMTTFSSAHVLRFLGRGWNGRISGEVTSGFGRRPEGVCVKHTANGNSVKMYDKGPNLLRIETTINNPRDLKVYRRSEGQPEGDRKWLPMRKGIADLPRRAEMSAKTNERYQEALATLDTTTRLGDLMAPVSRRRRRNGRTVRPVRVWTDEDQALFAAIHRPEFLLAGFRNRDLAQLLYPRDQATADGRRRAAARISYRLRVLRAHGVIAKVTRTRRYRTTERGRQIITAALVSQNVTVAQLTNAAA